MADSMTILRNAGPAGTKRNIAVLGDAHDLKDANAGDLDLSARFQVVAERRSQRLEDGFHHVFLLFTSPGHVGAERARPLGRRRH